MKSFFSILFSFLVFININAQILDVPEVTQEENQWCWAGVSKAILDYYGANVSQCEIAEYVRDVSTWHDFGDIDCCENPNLGCNYWNYNWGTYGSIQDILIHFEGIENYGHSDALSKDEVDEEIIATRPFVVRWGWSSGGGHFVVGYGVSGDYVYYMDPWFGEGYHMSTYDWLVDDGNHTWTHTNIITTTLTTSNTIKNTSFNIYPNPASNLLIIETNQSINQVQIFDSFGKNVGVFTDYEIDVSYLNNGVYTIKIVADNQVYNSIFIKE